MVSICDSQPSFKLWNKALEDLLSVITWWNGIGARKKPVAWEKLLNLNHKTEKEARDEKIVINKKVLRSKMTKRSTHAKTRQNACSPSTARTKSPAGRSSGEGATADAGATIAAIALRTASNFSSSGMWVLSMLENTDQNVRTIEQILFKYSRERHRHLNGLYWL